MDLCQRFACLLILLQAFLACRLIPLASSEVADMTLNSKLSRNLNNVRAEIKSGKKRGSNRDLAPGELAELKAKRDALESQLEAVADARRKAAVDSVNSHTTVEADRVIEAIRQAAGRPPSSSTEPALATAAEKPEEEGSSEEEKSGSNFEAPEVGSDDGSLEYLLKRIEEERLSQKRGAIMNYNCDKDTLLRKHTEDQKSIKRKMDELLKQQEEGKQEFEFGCAELKTKLESDLSESDKWADELKARKILQFRETQ